MFAKKQTDKFTNQQRWKHNFCRPAVVINYIFINSTLISYPVYVEIPFNHWFISIHVINSFLFFFLPYTCDVEKDSALLLVVHGVDLIQRPPYRIDAHLIAVILWVLALDHRGRRICMRGLYECLRGNSSWRWPNSERLALPLLWVLAQQRIHSLVYQCGLRATSHSNLHMSIHDKTQYI